MEYEQKARMAAERLLSYRDDQSGWQVCKKSVRFDFTCLRCLNDTFAKPSSLVGIQVLETKNILFSLTIQNIARICVFPSIFLLRAKCSNIDSAFSTNLTVAANGVRS